MRIPRGPLTDAIIAINIILFLAGLLTGRAQEMAILGGFIPARLSGALLPLPAVPALLTPLSSAFLHADFFHLLFNMLLLLFCGRHVEMALGGRLYLLLYALAAFGAAAVQWAIGPGAETVVIGASGAMSGVVAAYMLLFSQAEEKAWGPLPARWARAGALLLMWILINVAMGIGGMLGREVAIGSHIGGFVTGLLLARPMLRFRYRRA